MKTKRLWWNEPNTIPIDVWRGAFAASFGNLLIPSRNPHTPLELRVHGFQGEGVSIELIDPMGSRIWSINLEAAAMPELEKDDKWFQ